MTTTELIAILGYAAVLAWPLGETWVREARRRMRENNRSIPLYWE